MVSFSCESCGDVLTKKKLDPHRNQCRGASFTCLDCMIHFQGIEYRSHTSCITEAQKYQGALYKNTSKKKGQQQKLTAAHSQALVPRQAYVEDAAETDDRVALVDAPPRAPSPPPQDFNVFEFLVENGPAASPIGPLLTKEDESRLLDDREWESDPDVMEAECYDSAEDTYAAAREYMKVEMMKRGYDGQFRTPGQHSRGHQRNVSNASMDSATRESNKKRKRGHVEELDLSRAKAGPPNGDIVMTDVALVTHSGLTGGLDRLLARPELPPSPPDMDGVFKSPHSPLKRTKHSTSEKERGRAREKEQEKGKRKENDKKSLRSSDQKDVKEKEGKKQRSSHADNVAGTSGRWERRRSRRDTDSKDAASAPAQQESRKPKAIEHGKIMKTIEYQPMNDSNTEEAPGNGHLSKNGVGEGTAMILHPKRAVSNAEHFMSFVTKGPESERGCSINKVLKRYHRDRGGRGRSEDEKDLWKVLRLRKNEGGEIVLFVEERP